MKHLGLCEDTAFRVVRVLKSLISLYIIADTHRCFLLEILLRLPPNRLCGQVRYADGSIFPRLAYCSLQVGSFPLA